MKAEEVYKISEEANPPYKDVRFDKYIEYLNRDIIASAKTGKYRHTVNFTDRPIRDELIFKIQEYFLSEGFEIIRQEEPERYREFIISWKKDDE